MHYALQKSCGAPFSFLACYILTSCFSGWGEETCVLFILGTASICNVLCYEKKLKTRSCLTRIHGTKVSGWKCILFAWAYLCSFPPAKYLRMYSTAAFLIWSVSFLSVRGHSCKPVPNRLNLKSCFSAAFRARFTISCSSLFPKSLPVSLSQVLPWMVFLKWRSPRLLRIQWHLGKGRRGWDPVTSQKTQTPSSNEGQLLTSWVVTRPVPYLSPKEISSSGSSAMCFFGITINGELALHLQVDPIRSWD